MDVDAVNVDMVVEEATDVLFYAASHCLGHTRLNYYYSRPST